MSLSRLTAGGGYRYLLRHTACGDCARDPATSLTSYYAASGYPPGRWLGSGLAGLDAGRGLAVRTTVSEEAMSRLFGAGQDPVTGAALGAKYPAFRSADERIEAVVRQLPNNLDEEARAAAITKIEERERARPVRAAVAGFDLTFTMPKSASVLWGIGDPATQATVAGAHTDAVTAVLGLIEDRFVRTRVGKRSCAQVDARGLIAAAFDHWDTRTGDPNLHTHVVVANKVQGPDGKWRSLDSKALHHAVVACSETYDVVLADLLADRLSVQWSHRWRGERRSPAFEIDGVPDPLLAAFSGRAGQIESHLRELLTDFQDKHGRAPTRPEVLRLRQRATLATRPEKTVRPLAELVTRWRDRAAEVTGRPSEDTVHGVLDRSVRSAQAEEVPAVVVQKIGTATLAAVSERRSTWTRPNLLAEAARTTRGVRMRSPAKRLALLDNVVAAALEGCVALDPPDIVRTPVRFRRADGASAFTRPDEHAFTTEAVLDAERRLIAATETLGAPRIAPAAVVATLGPAGTDAADPAARLRARERGLTADQRHAVEVLATGGRALDVLVGPAGTGKTRTLNALRVAWEREHGPWSVLGLAPSATAAIELASALGIRCDNTAKHLHDTARGTQAGPRRGHLVIIDEASMVATSVLDTLVAQANSAGAKVVLVGDHQQLGAVDAGGAFGLLAQRPQALTLVGLWRFRQRWEANATRALRTGNPTALDAYAAHDRLHEGPSEIMLDQAYTHWAAEVAAGRSSILVAADRASVDALNARAHDDRVTAGLVQPDAVPLAGDVTCGRGDLVVTRRNDRRLDVPGDGHVRNGALWRVLNAHPDGALDVTLLHGRGSAGHASPGRVRLPAGYVRENVELGYATTVHRAQGMTVESAHVLAAAGMTRQALYVAMTRGREANQVYVTVDGIDPACPNPTAADPVPTGRQVLERILATDGAELSATDTLRARLAESVSAGRLLPIRDTLAAASDDPDCRAAADEITGLVRWRADVLRDVRRPASDLSGARPPLLPSETATQEGIHR